MTSNIENDFESAMATGKIHGGIMCATDAAGRFTYTRVLGQRTLLDGQKVAHQADDVLYLASATKLLASIAALQCVEDGLLTLTGDLSAIAPELAAKQVLTGFSDDGKTPLFEPQVRPITLEMLLTHSCGLVYYFIDPKIAQWRKSHDPTRQGGDPERKMTVEETFNYPLSFQPGSQWMYGPGLDWAGRIVERITGKTLQEYLQQRTFGPLGIVDASFYPITREDLRARTVDLNPEDPEGVGKAVVNSDNSGNARSKGDFGGQGLFMTAPDYLKVLHSLLANDGKILKPTTVEDMFENHLSPEASANHKVIIDGPVGSHFRVGSAPGTKAGYGLGGFVTQEDSAWYSERTMTWGGGFTLAWFVDQKKDLCGIVATQSAVPIDFDLVNELKHTFRTDIYRKRDAWREKLANL